MYYIEIFNYDYIPIHILQKNKEKKKKEKKTTEKIDFFQLFYHLHYASKIATNKDCNGRFTRLN